MNYEEKRELIRAILNVVLFDGYEVTESAYGERASEIEEELDEKTEQVFILIGWEK